MGETGCGKTLLISKIYELLNNGETHWGFTDEDIIKKIKIINDNAKESIEKNKKIWVFIDEINTCKSIGLFNEIICNHSCNKEKLESNLIFIGACNPYSKFKNELELMAWFIVVKILWIESNYDYIINILKVYNI